MKRDPSRARPVWDPADVHVRLLRLLASPTYRAPVLPAVALEIVQLSARPEATFEDVGAVLERDPMLAAKVLSIAQSAVHAPRSPILSLRGAAVRLGLATLRDLVVEAALTLRVFRVPGYDAVMERLSRHSTATAYLMRLLCERTGVDAEYAFLCGLLHDVGIAACLLALSDDARAPAPVPLDVLAPLLDALHEQASGVVTRLWDLPSEIQVVVGTHHQLEVGGTPHPVNATLIVAEALAGALDAGMAPLDARDRSLDACRPGLVDAARAVLRLDAASFEALQAEAATVVQALRADSAER